MIEHLPPPNNLDLTSPAYSRLRELPAHHAPVNSADVTHLNLLSTQPLDPFKTSSLEFFSGQPCAFQKTGEPVPPNVVSCDVDGGKLEINPLRLSEHALLYVFELVNSQGEATHIFLSGLATDLIDMTTICSGSIIGNWIGHSMNDTFGLYFHPPSRFADQTGAIGDCYDLTSGTQETLITLNNQTGAETTLSFTPSNNNQVLFELTQLNGQKMIKLDQSYYPIQAVIDAWTTSYAISGDPSEQPLIIVSGTILLDQLDGLDFTMPTITPSPTPVPTEPPPPAAPPITTGEAIRLNQEPRTVIGNQINVKVNLGTTSNDMAVYQLNNSDVSEIQNLLSALQSGDITMNNFPHISQVLRLNNPFMRALRNAHASLHNFLLVRPGTDKLFNLTTPMDHVPDDTIVMLNADTGHDHDRTATFVLRYMYQFHDNTTIIATDPQNHYYIIQCNNNAIGDNVSFEVVDNRTNQRDPQGSTVFNSVQADYGSYFDPTRPIDYDLAIFPMPPIYVNGDLRGRDISQSAADWANQTFTVYTHSDDTLPGTTNIRPTAELPYGPESAGYYTGRVIYIEEYNITLAEMAIDLSDSGSNIQYFFVPIDVQDTDPN